MGTTTVNLIEVAGFVKQSNLTVFANFFIDSEERFLRMKDSFISMKGIQVDQYIVNVRGRFAANVADFLQSNIPELKIFFLQSYLGWFYDTSMLLGLINTSYVLLWIEDHLCLTPHLVNAVVNEMEDSDADILTYSFWQNGAFLDRYAYFFQHELALTSYFDHDVASQNKNPDNSFLISYASILKASLFNKIINDNGVGMNWPKESPFGFEKPSTHLNWLPLRRSIVNFELFASIDDDHGSRGSSLISRSLYPKRIERTSYASSKNKFIFRIKRLCQKVLIAPRLLLKFFMNLFKVPLRWKWDYVVSILKLKIYLPELPWMNYAFIDFIYDNLNNRSIVFEYGSGDSTKFWCLNCYHVVSIEHDYSFYLNCSKLLKDFVNLDYRLIEPEIDLCALAFDPASPVNCHSSDFKGYTFQNYVHSISTFTDLSFDIVVIYGRARPSCLYESISKLKPGGILVFDNSNRPHYFEKTYYLVSSWKRLDFVGPVRSLLHQEQTTVFIKPS